MSIIDVGVPGQIVLLMGNEAIARGSLEGGIQVATAYPGNPSSEIVGSLAKIAKSMDIYVEWSVNEKVALEVASSASMAGLRSVVAMKQNGLNVASDYLFTLNLMGVKGGLVVVVCDDPSALSSSNEEDTRGFSRLAGLPLLEPATFQEAKDMMKYALELSEEMKTVVMVRSVTRISHARGNVKLGNLSKSQRQAKFDVTSPFTYFPVVQKHSLVHEKLVTIIEDFESSSFNSYEGPEEPDLMLIVSGSGLLYAREAVHLTGLTKRIGILKVGTTWPLPASFITTALSKSNRFMFVEEVDAFLESNVKEIWVDLCATGGSNAQFFYGKRSGHMPAVGELNTECVVNGLKKVLSIKYDSRDEHYAKRALEVNKEFVPGRSIGFCPGCPHRASYWAIKNALRLDGRDGFVTNDIGCYALARTPSGYSLAKTGGAMGSGTGVACGFGLLQRFGFEQPVVGVCGDSTFFHAAMPALVNAQYTRSNFVMCILDNSATAMTGFQPHPGVGQNAMGDRVPLVDIEGICRSIGAKVEVLDPFDLDKTTETLLRLFQNEEAVKVLILKRTCELLRQKSQGPPYRMHVDPQRCIGLDCGCNQLCIRVFRCPGLVWDTETQKARIDEVTCAGCGVCADICPTSAIVREEV